MLAKYYTHQRGTSEIVRKESVSKLESPEMKTEELRNTAQALVAGDKGLLAMDESTPTCNKRFAAAGIPQNEEMRRAYREMIVTTPGVG